MDSLLDTHVVVWWYQDAKELPVVFRSELERLELSGQKAFVSGISLWEIAKLVEKGKLRLAAAVDEFLRQIETDRLFTVAPISARIAAESIRLGPSFPRDPADQL